MTNPLPTIKSAVGNFFDNLVPANRFTVNNPAPATPANPSLNGVPAQYQPAVYQAAAHTGIAAPQLADQFQAENGGTWSPTLKGRVDPTDFGMTQLNPVAVATITGKAGPGRNYFKDNYGHEFNPADGNDQILAAGVYLNYLRQFGLPGAGIKNPTTSQVMTSYNTGAQGLANANAGQAGPAARARSYQALLQSRGAIQ